ncbi:MAG: hypothetical protein JNL70_17480 [Saprospiraceae bacterium]|nr:hypothetical protein [Saprospiraceae bacterium]
MATILLLTLILFNAFGYYSLFVYEKKQARFTELQNIADSDLQVIKMNVAIYTSVGDRDFEYLDKEMCIENKAYHIVKKKIVNDTAYLYYLRNFKQETLQKQLNNIVETQTLTKQSSNKETPLKQLLNNFLKDYISDNIYILVVNYPTQMLDTIILGNASKNMLSSPDLSNLTPPPKVV